MQWMWLVVGLIVGFVVGWWWVNRNLTPLIEAAESERDSEKARADTAEVDLAECATALSEAQNNNASLASDLETLTSERDGVMTELEASNRALSEAQREGDAALSAQKHGEELLEFRADEIRAAQAAAAEAEAKYQQVTDEFVEVRRQARQAESERDQVLTDRDGSAADLKAKAKAAEAAATGAQDEIAALSKSLSISEARVEALGEATEEAARAHQELGEARTRLSHAEARIVELENAARSDAADDEESGGTATPAGVAHDPGMEEPSVDSGSVEHTLRADVGQHQIAEVDLTNESGQDTEPLREASSDGTDGEPQPTSEILSEEPEPSATVQDGDGDIAVAEVAEGLSPDIDVAGQESATGDSTKTPSAEDAATPSAPATVEADDLRQVKGIGPKFEGLLHERGVVSFAQIAAISDDTELEEYLDTFAGRIEREDWRGQAQALHSAKYGESP